MLLENLLVEITTYVENTSVFAETLKLRYLVPLGLYVSIFTYLLLRKNIGLISRKIKFLREN